MKKKKCNVKKRPVKFSPHGSRRQSSDSSATGSSTQNNDLEESVDMEDVSDLAPSRLTVLQCRNLMYDKLIETGKIDLVKRHLKDVLRSAGWHRLMRERCFDYVNDVGGPENLNVSHMTCDLVPFGREQVPAAVRESMKEVLADILESYFTVDESASHMDIDERSDTYVALEYQPRDTIPDYGDLSVFDELPDTTLPSPIEYSPPPPLIPLQVCTDVPVGQITATSPGTLSRELGGIVLLDRVDREDEAEVERAELERQKTEKREREQKERQERERVRQELEKELMEKLEKERLEKLERERQEKLENERMEKLEKLEKTKNKKEKERERQERERQERERQEQKERERLEKDQERKEQKERERLEKDHERQEQKERERHERRERHNQPPPSLSSSVPSSPAPSPSTPRPDKKGLESASTSKLGQTKQPPSLASTLITATAAIAGKKSKHINLTTSDNDDDDEDDEELMDI